MEQAAEADNTAVAPGAINDDVEAGLSKVSPDAATVPNQPQDDTAGVSQNNDAADTMNIKADVEAANVASPTSPEPNASKTILNAANLNPN